MSYVVQQIPTVALGDLQQQQRPLHLSKARMGTGRLFGFVKKRTRLEEDSGNLSPGIAISGRP